MCLTIIAVKKQLVLNMIVCVYILALGIWHGNCIISVSYNIVICDLFSGTIFFNIIGHKLCVFTVSTSFVWSISHSEKNSARYDR